MRMRIALQSAVRSIPALLVVLTADAAHAQGNRRTVMTITGFPLTTTGTTVLDFDAGSVAVGSTNFDVNLTTNTGGGGFSPRVTTVRVRCNTPCPNSGTLPLTGLQWRRSDLGVWNTLTTAFVTVETRTATFSGLNDPWANSLFWRYVLTYVGTPPTAATAYRVQFQLQVTAP
jgi:hypothetical protein